MRRQSRSNSTRPQVAGMLIATRRRCHVSRFLLRYTLYAVALVPLLVMTAAAQAPSGYPGMTPEPSTASKFSSSVKSGFNKMAHALIPQASPRSAPDPISLSVKAKPSAQFHTAVARMAEGSGDLTKAEHHYRQALELTPTHTEALMGYAHMLDRQDELPEATELYRLAAETAPNNSTALNDLGICYARQGKLSEAVESIQKAIQLQPKQPRYCNNIATILVQAKRYDEAFSYLNAVHPRAVAYYNLGFLLQKAGDKKGAVRMFQESLTLDSTLTQSQVWLSQLGPALASEQARQPQTVAQRPVWTPTAPMAPTNSAAPMPPSGLRAPMPQSRPAPQMGAPIQATPQHLAPLPSIRPLPPVQRGY